MNTLLLGQTLKSLREKAGLSRFRLAAKSGVSPQGIERIEKGESINVGIKTLLSLTTALNIELTELLPSLSSEEQQKFLINE